MPLTLDSTRALRGETKRKWTLVVMGHGRWPYLDRALQSVADFRFDRTILSFDGPGREFSPPSDVTVLSTGPERKGLSANLAQAWGALTAEDEYVFHLEEDFLVHEAPLDEMADTLEAYRNVANMVLVRQPWNAEEIRRGSVLRVQRFPLEDRGGWLEHTNGFWLNPMVAHASLLRSLKPGVEQHLTNQCLARRLSFGYWGGINDEPRCEHIGVEGGMGSDGWVA
jgi:hypothetical protein